MPSEPVVNPNKIVSTREIAQVVKISPITVRLYTRKGRFGPPVYQPGPRTRRWRLGDVMRAFTPNQVRPAN